MTQQSILPAASVAIASARPKPAQRLAGTLTRAGHRTWRCEHLHKVLECLEEVDLVLLDPDLPPLGGLEACTAVRKASIVPVMIFGRQTSERERITYLEQGADVVLGWPVGDLETLARVRAHLRRRSMELPLRQLHLSAGRTLDLDNRVILVNGQTYALTPTEARLMRALASRLGRPYPVRELVETVWGRSYVASSAETDILRANIYRIRRKLEVDPRDPRLLRFLPGHGWVLGQMPNDSRVASPAQSETSSKDAAGRDQSPLAV